MKIEVHEKPAAPKYPCLMQSGSTVVLFENEKNGTVIKHRNLPAGTHSSSWIYQAFTPFTGSVTLSND